MTTLFISDLHLSPTTPDITQCFVRFMREEAIHADALYVLGDLFEFWIGDDDRSDFASSIRAEFKTLTDKGIPCFFTQGNRDFLVGKRFSRQTGVTLLGDETVIDLYGRKAIVLHGDTLCTQDVKYLEYRAKVHQPWLQWVFNRIPMFVKKKIVNKVQSDIKTDKQTKSLDIMDVTQSEVENVMQHHNVDLMIHGHTHRPKVHSFQILETDYTRIVLGDWYTQGSVLVYDKNGFELQQRPFAG
ncbi:UDP-2,3-diacylglucosamine diphosphatase [Vibrio tubiashii]|uniref:UDP-2,3-diacylglucosamine diphosphatase n=1 Tax=Vibrio tubiashii TaxID=29498 RepID=UPI001EFE3E00|nr:UDP-2,3-diacylglucosamine diphosphatase [Vibrio tubiashii]MCG9583062.1 UDP-2,3-diacylglucosamine diphosphatase [Vibrio tubiashii]MCG9616656.1 UDP-2,3-diacylglucosamine diphosphatase [Vibrio tubiashii]MCG9689149.1 UDP-2,3-diacylglucosamine diphosphatase [Vibrio tubiashii]